MVQGRPSSQPIELVGRHGVFCGNLKGLSGTIGNLQANSAGAIAVEETL